jgi:hypothetical protein
MANYELHYAKLNLKGNIPVYKFESFNDLSNYVLKILSSNQDKRVYVIAKDFETRCPIITDDIDDVYFVLNKFPSFGFKSATFIQEYNSFEEAYKVALTMVENNVLCYS